MSASIERAAEVSQNLADIRSRVKAATPVSASSSDSPPVLVAVSKYKPAADILTCYEDGHRDFGENYVQELVEKAEALPLKVRWHFIGTFQSNKAKTLAAIPNLDTVQTITSVKAAKALQKAIPTDRIAPLNVLIQVNTSGEGSKSGLDPLTPTNAERPTPDPEILQVAQTIVSECPSLRLRGLMTIGSLEQSLTVSQAHEKENADFERLKETRDVLQRLLVDKFGGEPDKETRKWRWGREEDGKLLLSMGMSSDFEAALRAGSDVVRVGTGIFGERRKKEEVKQGTST